MLHLSPTELTIDLSNENNPNLKVFNFRSGESQVAVKNLKTFFGPEITTINIKMRYNGDVSLFRLAMIVDVIRQYNCIIPINLFVPYFPAARQDRVCESGDSFSLKVYSNFINDLGFNSVHVYDPHSDVVIALVERAVAHDNSLLVNYAIKSAFHGAKEDVVLLSPDAGSNKKIYKLAKTLAEKDPETFGAITIIRADKVRDTKTGAILETIVYADDLTEKTVFIVDDICSGGRTFTEIAKILRTKNARKVYLIVSHHEGVADLQYLHDCGIEKVYATNSMVLSEHDTPLIKTVDVFHQMMLQDEQSKTL